MPSMWDLRARYRAAARVHPSPGAPGRAPTSPRVTLGGRRGWVENRIFHEGANPSWMDGNPDPAPNFSSLLLPGAVPAASPSTLPPRQLLTTAEQQQHEQPRAPPPSSIPCCRGAARAWPRSARLPRPAPGSRRASPAPGGGRRHRPRRPLRHSPGSAQPGPAQHGPGSSQEDPAQGPGR